MTIPYPAVVPPVGTLTFTLVEDWAISNNVRIVVQAPAAPGVDRATATAGRVRMTVAMTPHRAGA